VEVGLGLGNCELGLESINSVNGVVVDHIVLQCTIRIALVWTWLKQPKPKIQRLF